ncbi:hypothetical protein [Rhodoblastus sp.]|uniref:hypothetical protein n=1 Tax=Rhodoblastus sp. TaxID=1962975 RepID=UPI003F9DCD5E
MVATIKARNGFPMREVLESCGIDSAGVVKSVGLDRSLFANREAPVLFADVARLIVECVRVSGCDDFRLQ